MDFMRILQMLYGNLRPGAVHPASQGPGAGSMWRDYPGMPWELQPSPFAPGTLGGNYTNNPASFTAMPPGQEPGISDGGRSDYPSAPFSPGRPVSDGSNHPGDMWPSAPPGMTGGGSSYDFSTNPFRTLRGSSGRGYGAVDMG